MASQYDRLRVAFDGMDATQKEQFIAKLKAMPNRTPEHMQFVAECVQKYNGAIGSGSVRTATRNDYDDLLNNINEAHTWTQNYKIAEPAKRLLAYILDGIMLLPIHVLFGVGLSFLGLSELDEERLGIVFFLVF